MTEKKKWQTPSITIFGDIEQMTLATERAYCLPYARVEGYVKHCGFGDAVVNGIGLPLSMDMGS
jgi:hypothetical protein